MKHQVQAKLLRDQCRLPDHPGHLLPLFGIQTLAAISGNPARDPVPRFRLRVGKNQEGRPQGGKQAADSGDGDDDFQEFFIGSIEERPDDVLVASPTSPLGEALLHHTIGEVVQYEAPSGILRVKIVGLR